MIQETTIDKTETSVNDLEYINYGHAYEEFTDDDYEEDKISGVGNYTFLRTIGHGQFGKVKLAVHNKTKTKVAIKVIKKGGIDEGASKFILREIQIMKRLRHPNIIQLYEVIDTEARLFLVMEYASGGEVMDFIAVHGRLKERDASNFFAQVAWAVHYCHSQKTVHRDIKAENLLLDDHMNVKLIDFGLSNIFYPPQKLRTFCGSPMYAAPELVQHHEYVGPEVDCWSLGVLLYFLVCGSLPFGGESYAELYQQIMRANYTLPPYLSAGCRDLIRHMLVSDPTKRFTIEEIVRHPWVMKMHGTTAAGCPGNPKYEVIDTTVLSRLERLGYERAAVTQSLLTRRFDDPFAVYHILSAETETHRGMTKLEERRPIEGASRQEEERATKQEQTYSECKRTGLTGASAKPATLCIGTKKGDNLEEQETRDKQDKEKHYYSLKLGHPKQEKVEKHESNEYLMEASTESPRQKRFAFSVEMTTEKDYNELMHNIKHVLDLHDPRIKYVHLSSFMLECDCAAEGLIFEIEICRLYRLSMNGVRFHRIKGKNGTYKRIMKSVVEMLKL